MKTRTLTFLLGILFTFPGISQTQIDNPSFDSVYFGGIDRIFQWVTSDGVGIHGVGSDTILPLQPNTFYDASSLQYSEILDIGVFIDTTPYSNFALRLKSQPLKFKADGSQYESYVVNGTHFYTDSMGYIDFSKCGTPFTGTPTALIGFYKLIETSAVPNFGHCEILLKKYNVNMQKHDTIAYVNEQIIFNPAQSWEPFTIPITYRASSPPDSIVVVFKPAAAPHLPVTFWVDDLDFLYGTIGLEENATTNFKIQPNPVHSVLKVHSNEENWSDFTIIDAAGKTQLKGKQVDEISVEHLAQGRYYIIFNDASGHATTLKFSKY